MAYYNRRYYKLDKIIERVYCIKILISVFRFSMENWTGLSLNGKKKAFCHVNCHAQLDLVPPP